MTKRVTFNRLLGALDRTFASLPDQRTRPNRLYSLRDAAMAAFSVFFMQSPSFLAHQELMQQTKGHSNAGSLFRLGRIPSDPHIRNLLDPLPPDALSAPFWEVFGLLEEAGELAAYRSFAGQWLVSLDGTQYFHSTKIHCQRCTVSLHGDRQYYTHTAITPVLVAPGESRVIALEPEFIQPQDGHEKQDCERNAGKRWLLRQAQHLAGRRVTLLGDDLYCNQPFCEAVLAQRLNFIFTCKPDSHTALYEEVELLGRLGAVTQLTHRHWTGQQHEIWTYRYVNDVPLRAGPAARKVSWCELTILQAATGEQVYHNAFATNHRLTDETVAPVVTAGRARWKIENENNNVLKNYGYHLEHNFGHGEQSLSMILVLLNLLAFLLHTVLDLCDPVYHRLRDALRVRKTFFNDLKALTRDMRFESWDQMLNFMYLQLELDQPPRTARRRKR